LVPRQNSNRQGWGGAYKALGRETGVTRASIMSFVRGAQALRLAAYFGLELRAKRKGR
jgi:hypothetical protein